jgi:2',3'-cyclic-nucleotide 2'-phosphodiesterase (5'-nucleotidase family)
MRSLRHLLGLALLLSLIFASAAAADDGDLRRLHLLWTNDIHGHIAPEPARFMNPEFPPPLGGAPSAAAYIKRVRAEAAAAGEDVLLVDVGDIFQGTPIGNKTEGRAVVEYFNAIGYDLVVPGNHDFDLGRDVAEDLAERSDFPWVAANLIEESTGEVVDWCVPTLMLERAGLRIGVVGIITPGTAAMSFPENIAGLEFRPMAPTIAKYRDRLREQGADIIFLGIHEGLPYDPEAGWQEIAGAVEQATDDGRESEMAPHQEKQEDQGYHAANYSGEGIPNLMELVNMVPGIDIAVGGHTHQGYQEPWIDPVNHTMCFETYGNGSGLGHAILLVDPQLKEIVGWERSHDRGTIVTLFEDQHWPDQEIAEVIRPHQEKAEQEMARVVGETAVPLTRGDAGANVMGNLVTDAMRTRFEADFSFQNLGGLRANLPAGPITAGDVFRVLPFGNELVLVEMQGAMIRRVIERKLRGNSRGICISGAEVVYDKTRPDWDRVVELTIGGEPLDPEATYQAVFTNFLLEGNSGLDFLTTIAAEAVMPTQVRTAEAVEWYLEQNSPVRPRIDDRWVEKPGQAQAPYLQEQELTRR